MYAYSSGYGRDGERLANFPGNPFYDDRSRRRRQIHYLEHTLMSTGGSLDEVIGAWALTTRPSDSPRGGCRAKSHTNCRRAVPPDSRDCLGQRAREFEESKEKGDAPKAKREFPSGAC